MKPLAAALGFVLQLGPSEGGRQGGGGRPPCTTGRAQGPHLVCFFPPQLVFSPLSVLGFESLQPAERLG